MQFLVSYESSEHKESALNLAKDFNLPFVTKESKMVRNSMMHISLFINHTIRSLEKVRVD